MTHLFIQLLGFLLVLKLLVKSSTVVESKVCFTDIIFGGKEKQSSNWESREEKEEEKFKLISCLWVNWDRPKNTDTHYWLKRVLTVGERFRVGFCFNERVDFCVSGATGGGKKSRKT